MKNNIQLIIGTIILMGIICGYTAYSDYQLNHKSLTGTILENNIQAPDLDDIFIPAKGK